MGRVDVPWLRVSQRLEVRSEMASHLHALCFDTYDPLRLASFWAGVLGWEMTDDARDGIALLPADDTGLRLGFRTTQEQKVGQNQLHFDLTRTGCISTSPHLSAVISKRRSTVSSPSGRLVSRSAKARSVGS